MWLFKKKLPIPVQETKFEWVMTNCAMDLADDYLRRIDAELIKIAKAHVTEKDRYGNPLITVEDMRFAGEKILESIDEWASVMD